MSTIFVPSCGKKYVNVNVTPIENGEAPIEFIFHPLAGNSIQKALLAERPPGLLVSSVVSFRLRAAGCGKMVLLHSRSRAEGRRTNTENTTRSGIALAFANILSALTARGCLQGPGKAVPGGFLLERGRGTSFALRYY